MTIENTKTYKGKEVDNLFFRPTFTGTASERFDVRVLYNMPLPTTVQVWSGGQNILQEFSCGWSGEPCTKKKQKTIQMQKVKAENAFSAENYNSLIYEQFVTSADVNMGDLTGTELEKIETEMFRKAIAENIRVTMWLGDTTGEVSDYGMFDGFLRHLLDATNNESGIKYESFPDADDTGDAKEILNLCWINASEALKAMRPEGNLVFYVSSSVYNKYLEYLQDNSSDATYNTLANVEKQLCFFGIPVVEVPLGRYPQNVATTFCILTDRRNMVLALNTADSPENEVRMWYNPDELENRQRAVFLAGTTVIDPELVSWAYSSEE